jgi:predicted nucleotidyltransferase
MLTLTATDFFNNPGRRNQEVQNEPIEVKSHGRTVGVYVSAHEYKSLVEAAQRAAQPGMYNSIKPLIHEYRNEILAIAKRYGIEKILLTGSVARGDDKPQSDIDFLVQYPVNHVPSFDDLGIGAEIGEMFGGRRIEIINLARVDQRLKPSMLADAVEL